MEKKITKFIKRTFSSSALPDVPLHNTGGQTKQSPNLPVPQSNNFASVRKTSIFKKTLKTESSPASDLPDFLQSNQKNSYPRPLSVSLSEVTQNKGNGSVNFQKIIRDAKNPEMFE